VSGLDLSKPARRGEALSNEFDGRVLNPNGVEIDLPYWVFKRLKKLHLLERDRETGKRRIKKQALEAMAAWDGPSSGQKGNGRGANADWREVYREECRNPGYVIENGRPPVKLSSKLQQRNLP
jgi:hypothetical protein